MEDKRDSCDGVISTELTKLDDLERKLQLVQSKPGWMNPFRTKYGGCSYEWPDDPDLSEEASESYDRYRQRLEAWKQSGGLAYNKDWIKLEIRNIYDTTTSKYVRKRAIKLLGTNAWALWMDDHPRVALSFAILLIFLLIAAGLVVFVLFKKPS